MHRYLVRTPNGTRSWWADHTDHAREQHIDAFGVEDEDERIIEIESTLESWEEWTEAEILRDRADYYEDLNRSGYFD